MRALSLRRSGVRRWSSRFQVTTATLVQTLGVCARPMHPLRQAWCASFGVQQRRLLASAASASATCTRCSSLRQGARRATQFRLTWLSLYVVATVLAITLLAEVPGGVLWALC
jgi:hypothetical protein